MKGVQVGRRVDDIAGVLDVFAHWIESFGQTSYDYQTFFAGGVGGRAKALYYRRPLLGTAAVAPMIFCEAFLPSARRLFWTKQRFPIADAHYAMGFALLAKFTGRSEYYDRAVNYLNVLEQTRCPGYQLRGWGYPFDWVTRNGVIKTNTPLITTTPYAYEAFEAVHAIDGNRKWADVMQSIAEHAFKDIPDTVLGENEAAAGYFPGDPHGCVINASAYRAFLLTAASVRFGREDYRAAAERNLNFVLRRQHADGSWYYADDGVRTFIDHYHTCFVLKALAKIEPIAPSEGCREAIERGVQYYTTHLFDQKGVPRPFAVAPRLTVYRQELYDYAECINLGGLLRGRYASLDARVDATLDDLLANWVKPDGSFRSRRLMLGWDNVPMHRWGQSQVFRALVAYAVLTRSAS
jgi:hypothetical protein